MAAGRTDRIFLLGISGAGKSTAGQLLAALLGWRFVDTDREIERHAGRSIPDLFGPGNAGEPGFRRMEARLLTELAGEHEVVVATGGGAVTNPDSRNAMASGFRAWLQVEASEAARRLVESPGSEGRPLLRADDSDPELAGRSPREVATVRLQRMLAARSPWYAEADTTLAVDGRSPREIALACLAALRGVAACVDTPGSRYDILVENGALDQMGRICRERKLRGRAFIVTDDAVGPLFEERAAAALSAGDYMVNAFRIPSGEEHKTLATVNTVYDWLIEHRVERQDFLVSLGGGVVTDLAGYAAATILRGIDFVHVPTSMLAMVDASVGGKTGVDHPRGKNLIGAFAQPRVVVIDPRVLETLPPRQLRNGWAEVIKHGFILDIALVADLEREVQDSGAMLSSALIARSVAIKAAVVSEDEREAGKRTLLNYGHTLGHAIESTTGYDTYLHGEAVALGMRAAGLMAVELGVLPGADFERQQALIRASGLPESAPGLDVDALLEATLQDKKVRSGAVQWILLRRLGEAYVHGPIPPDVVRRAVQAVTA